MKERERKMGFLLAGVLVSGATLAWPTPSTSGEDDTQAPSEAMRVTWRAEQVLSFCPFIEELAFADTAASEEFSQLQQSVAALAGGGFGTVWVEGTFPHRTVRMQWLDHDGRVVFSPGGRLLATEPGDYGDVVITPEATAGAYVAFEMDNDVVVQRFDAGGEPQWPGRGIVAVTRTLDQTVSTPYLVSNPDGGAFVCFHFSEAGPTLDIRCQRFDPTGARLWASNGASVGDGGSRELRVLPRGVSDGAGGLLLFWRNQRDPSATDPGPMLMEGQHFSSEGGRLWGPAPKVVRTTRLAADNSYTYVFFQVVSDGTGGAVLAFNDWTGTSDLAPDVMAQRVSGAGDLLWEDGVVVSGANGNQQHDQTIAAGDGGAFVVVYEGVSASHNRLILFRLAPDGTHAWSPAGVLVSSPGATALDYGAFGSFDDGVLRLAWTHQNFPASFELDVAFATYAPNGMLTGTTLLTTANDGQFLRGLARSTEFGGILTIWDDRRKGTWYDLDAGGALLNEPTICRSGVFPPRQRPPTISIPPR